MENNLAYITESNFWIITSWNDLKEWNNNLFKYKWKILNFIRNWDLIDLNKHSIFIKNMSEWEIWFYNKIEKQKDTFSRIFEWWTPAYHLYTDCSRLNSNFENYDIPDKLFDSIMNEWTKWILNEAEYKNSRENISKKFRVWFKKYWNNKEQLEKDYWIEWWLIKLNYDNSWIIQFENMTLNDIEEAIDKKIREHNFFIDHLNDKEKFFIKSLWKKEYFFKDIKEEWDEDIFWKIVLENHKVWINKNTFSEFKYNELNNLLKNYNKDYLVVIKNLLKKYINITYNKEFKFDVSLLESLWFHNCAECKKRVN